MTKVRKKMKIYKIRLKGTDEYLFKYRWVNFASAKSYHSVASMKRACLPWLEFMIKMKELNDLSQVEIVEFNVIENRVEDI